MGRHRRATPAAAPVRNGHRGSHRKRSAAPVRTGLLGASAAMAVGAVAVASGLVPGGGGGFSFGDSDGSTRVQADATPEIDLHGSPGDRQEYQEPPTSRDEDRGTASPSPDRSSDKPSSKKPSAEPTPEASPERSTEQPTEQAAPTPSASPSSKAPSPPRTTPPASPSASTTPGNSAEAQVLSLVNQERAKAGCQPVRADTGLAGLARDFSRDMADRGFFSHTDPDGKSPWDRAEARGISHMGGENIARGQASAQAVMDAWMNSPGHRANILNCDFKTLGVGAHFAQGGPWWTQAFGF